MQLEELKPGLRVEGLIPAEVITVIAAQWHGTDALALTYQNGSGGLGQQVVFRKDQDNLSVATSGSRAFDATASDFKLVAEAQRISLAGLFDPMLAVATSDVQPLPHQIRAVYGELLPRTPLRFLLADDPGAGKTHRAYLWSYSIGAFDPVKAVIYDFADSRAGKHAREFLGDWRGTLVCDDYSGYKALIADGVTEAGCMAHARRKFFDLHANNQSQIAQQALAYIQKLYQVEREAAELSSDERRRIRQEQARPILDELHDWLTRHRLLVPNGSSTAKAIDYSLKRWTALAHYVDDGQVPIDNNWIENRIRPIATGRKNWLFAGSLRAGKRAAAIMSLIQSAKLNGHDPFLYLKDILSRLPTQPNSRISELLPHRWLPESAA